MAIIEGKSQTASIDSGFFVKLLAVNQGYKMRLYKADAGGVSVFLFVSLLIQR